MNLKETLGVVYHPALHKVRASPFLHLPAIHKTIEKWIELYKQEEQLDSAKIKLRTWEICAKDIYTLLTGEQP